MSMFDRTKGEKLMDAKKIAAEFLPGKLITSVEPFGNGHINDTYLVNCNGKRYTLQMVNKNVFKKPEEVMENIIRVTKYIKNSSLPHTLLPMNFLVAKGGKHFIYNDEGDLYRMYEFVEDAISLDLPEKEEDFYNSALAFGEFQYLLKDFPAETLFETIPNFHNTPDRFNNFKKSLKENKSGRADTCKEEIDFVLAREDFYGIFEDARKNGELPLKVTHNDTKLNNCLLDKKTRKPLCVIDLDTIMPGFAVNDFGDSIRFGASTAAEDEKDLSKVHFSLHLFEVYTKGFMAGTRGTLTAKEKEFLPHGAKMMTVECGMRFLADYLDGDNYFKTSYPEHNLVRARTQFRLVKEMEENWAKMEEIVKKY